MAYNHRIWSSKCGSCGKSFYWVYRNYEKLPSRWKCQCGARNRVASLPEYPEVPRSLYIGADNAHLLKVFPVPPEEANANWALPYSVRSFIHQASRSLGGCTYSCKERGSVYDEPVFADTCWNPRTEDDFHSPDWNCHILGGWAAGQASCPLWETLGPLSQTDVERKFLHIYLRYVKDRQFPMLLPQVRVGIAERRRADFIAFVPLQFWKFKWVAIELDGAHPESKFPDDQARDKYYEEHKYEVLSLRPGAKGYFEEVRSLVEKFEIWMNLAETDASDLAVEARVLSTESPADDIPF